MTETFLILLAGGVMLAAAVCDPKQVELRWLRLCGILALCFTALGAYFGLLAGSARDRPPFAPFAALAFLTLIQLGFTQTSRRLEQRFAALATALSATVLGAALQSGITLKYSWALTKPLLHWLPDAKLIAAALAIGTTSGLALMDMLLGHAYLTAAKMTIAPFRRLNLALAIALAFSAACGIAAFFLERRWPIELFWPRFGIYIGTRWLVGLLIPGVFVYMAHDCIKRRSTQSATGILYVAGVLIFIGEIIALYLLRETGLPF